MENKNETVYVPLTKNHCRNLADFIQNNLIHEIREDENLTNVCWIKNMINLMEMFEDYGGMTIH